MAAVTCDANLSDEKASRKSELVVDGTETQATAFAEAIRTKYAAGVGKIVSVKRGDVAFTHTNGAGYKVSAE